MQFADGMREKRKLLKLSQSDLSRISGVPQSTISAVETGARAPTEETMRMIAEGLQCTVGELLGEIDQKQEKPTAVSGDGLKEEIVNLIAQLPEDQLPQIRDFVAWLKSRHAE